MKPDWLSAEGKIIEPEFCQDFLSRHPMKCIHDNFYTVDGLVTDTGKLKREIYEEISPYLHAKVAQGVEQIYKALKLAAYAEPLPMERDRIHVANGTVFLNGDFSEEKAFCNNRLKVEYRPDAPPPSRWLRFMEDLLNPEDIPTLQEYLGYCLIPSTKGQKMLMLIGRGGEGKSRIGLVLRALLGTNMSTGNIAKVETNKFARADLEHELVMVDDDMKLEALPQTNIIKAIITAELPMDLEKKGVQSYQGDLYVRFLGFGNGSLKALYNRSEGFFRRQIILNVKKKPADRMDDPFIAEKMCAEAEGIFLWCLDGLHRLMDNNYQFTINPPCAGEYGRCRIGWQQCGGLYDI